MDEKKKKVLKITGIVAIVMVLLGVIGVSIFKETKKVALQSDPEIRRSMEYEQVEDGDENTNSPYVQFDAFFLRDLNGDGYAESIRGTCRDISETDTLYMEINTLTNGTFKNGKITINSQNMNLQTAIVEDNVIKQNYISDNTTTIELKDMVNGTQKLMYGTVKASDFGNDTTKYSKINSITLTGTHVADNGTKTQVSKTVDFTVDWHGDVQASIYNYTGTQNIEDIVDETNKNVTLSFSISTRENVDELILKSTVLEGKIPEINGYKPTSVETTSTNVDFNYDSETGNFTFRKEATLGENGIVSNAVSDYNTFSLKVTYPYEVYEALTEDTISIQVPVQAYYEGYNNPSSEFENPIKSNIAERTITFLWRRPQGEIARFDATIGEYRYYDRNYVVSKEEPLKLYNGTAEETKDLYTVRWGAYTGNTQVVNSIQMKETQDSYTDRFLNSSNTYFNMSDYTNNVGIYFQGAENTLGEDGYIKVINDETGEEIHTFTKEDWGNYSSSNPYKYETPVKHIRIETSKANESSTLYVYNIKEIDDNVLVETFERAEFDKLQYVYTYLTGNIMQEGSSSYTKVNDDIANALYEAPISSANITVNRGTIGTQTKEDDINLTINTQTGYYNMKGWTNGKFIIELPEQILDVEINDVTISNSSVKILGYEIYEQNGQKFIRIETENTEEANYSITVNANLTADPRAVTQTTTVKLYGYNEACDNYRQTSQDIYDIDGDENLTENVNYATDSLFVVSPSSLLTNQQATDYNEKKETVVAPQIATIDKTKADTATIHLSVTNNYEGTISELDILGKIPFEGNTFSINGTDLGSNFTTEMLSEGITVPDDMKDKVTVYYSENENPTNDLNNGENGWKKAEEVTNWSAIKTYLIDLGDYVLQIDETREFSYKIKVPSTVQYNDVSYSTHAVYFSLDTEQGKYRTQTETSKLGFRIERKYNFNIEKIKENTEVPVQGATFSVTADGEEESRIGTTNNSGNIEIENLYVDKTYTLKEIRTPGSYETLGGNIRFKVSVADDKLVLNILEGEGLLKEYNVEQATGDSRGTINFKIENTPKYKLEITKKDQETGGVLEGVKYKLEGEGLGTGITATTNKEGKLILTGLSQEVEYTLTETEADGYYVNETPVKFKVQNNSGNLSFVVTSGSFTSNSQVTIGTGVTGLDAQDTVTAELTDEKIPTYSIKLKKLAKDEEMTLKGAQYMITGEGFDEDGETFITDDQGIITIPDLYEYVEGKNVTGVYTLKEITPPEGYSLDERELQFKAKRNAEGNLELEIIGENFAKTTSVENAGSETPVINIELEDEPLFKLTKIDAETRTPIPNAKFVIYEIDENYDEIGYAKDINGNQVGTVENGVPVVETDENGLISYGLKSGLYKAVEIEAPEGYELPENEEDRTYYFGVDASKTKETVFGTSVMNQVSGANWEKVSSVDNTSDNGYVVSGYFYNNADFNKDGVYDVKGNENEWSGFVVKYDKDGNLEFAKPVYTLDGEVKLHKVIQTNDGGYVAVGYYTGSNLTIGDATAELEGKTYNKALIVKFGSSGEYQWCAEEEKANVDTEATALGENLQGNVLVGITYVSGNAKIVEYGVAGGKQTEAEIPAEVKVTGITGENNQQAVVVSEGIADTTTGRIDTYLSGNIENKMTLDFNARDVARLDNGKYVIVGSYTGTAQSTSTKGNYDGIISVYDLNSNIIESNKFVRGTLDDVITSVKNTTDGGYIVGGYTYSSGVDLNNDNTNDISSISGNSDGFIIKYSEDGTQELVKQVQGNGYDQVEDVTERDENEFVAVGYFNSSSIKADKSDSSSLSLTSYSDGFMFNYGEIVTAPEIPETSEITVENNLKQFKITTDVEEINGVKGGYISGEDEQTYETVKFGKDSTKEIKIIPDTGYKVLKITINGQEYNFTPAEDGTVILPQFTDMRTDKHIVVSFSNTVSSIIVHHYLDGTETQVAPDETLSGNIGDSYSTAPKMDLEKYELKKDEEGNYVVPENASGTYTEEQQVVIYYYVEKEIPLTVHHYIEGTEEKVPLKDGGTAEDVQKSGREGESYTTSAVDDNLLSSDYELVEVPENSSGTYSGEEVVVTYYYKKVEREVLINKYSEDGTTPLSGVAFNIKTKDASKDIGTYTTNENGQISVILEAGEYVAIEVSVPEGYDMPSDNETEFSVEKEDDVVTLNITNTKTKGTVITHHYIEGTKEKVPSNSGTVIEDVIQTGNVGDIYATKEAENVAPNYEFVSTEGQTSGNIVEGTTEVIYYYKLKDPSITSEITKESSIEKITDVNQVVDYTMNYKGVINTYKGKATVTIVDELSFEIDESKPNNLAGGEYNKESKTITWTEEISDVDTFVNGTYSIDITKEIFLVYKDIDVTKGSISNKVTGTIKLETPEKEETTETTKEILTEYTVNIIANKVWNDNQEQSVRRPSSVTLVVKNGDEEVQSKVISNSNLVAGTTNQWSVEFTGLPKYDSTGKEIIYTVEERETNEGDLHFYEAEENNATVEDKQASITNNFVIPDDTVSVTVRKDWKDQENVNGRRPSSIKLQVKNGESVVSEQVVTEAEGWKHTFNDLPKYDANGKEIVYTASETEVNSGDLKFYTNTGVSGDMTNEYTITNTFTVPDEKIELTVNKVWKDNDIQAQRRPSVVVINVLGENEEIVGSYELNVASETSHTFTGLDKYNSKGQEINYTVEEKEKNSGDLHFYTGVVGNVENISENSKKVTITNTFKRPEDKTDVIVTKTWDDNSNEASKRPESIKVLLKNGSETVGEQEVNSSNAVSGNTNSWQYTFTGVEKYNDNGEEIVYSVDEAEVNSGDLQFYKKNISGLVVTNTFTQDTSTVDVPISKIWIDNDEQVARRPESIKIILKANEVNIKEHILTGTGDVWNYTFQDLPKYDSYNNIINYTVGETEVNSGDLKFYNSIVDGTTITNTFTRPNDVISIEVTKNWEDQGNVYGKRPVSVRVNVNNGVEVVQTAIITKDNLWKHTFTNLPKYDENGREVIYTLSEEEVIENDLFYYTEDIGKVTNKVGETDVKEAVITNNMTKIPGKVIVKYVDKATGEEISEEKTKEGIVGETFDVTEDVKEIPGYTLVETPKEKTGTYTVKAQEKIYYYAKNTSVLVKYLEKDNTPEDDSDNKVLSEEILLGGYEGESYSTNSKVIDGYTLVETKGNLRGTMKREQQVVVYYYSKDTKVIVKHLRKDDTPNITTDNEILSPQEEIVGYVGKDYTTTQKLIPGYTLVEKTTNYQGKMTEEVIEVIYYYAKNTSVVVKYLEKGTNVKLEDEVIIEGYEGKDYKTEQKEIENYTFVEDTENTSGKMEEEQIEVIYYYAQNTKAKVQHIDRETRKILKEETKDGKVGDLFETHPEDFDGYVLVESPEEPNIIMDKTGNQVVKYYYAHISAGVIEKHIDIITGELLYSSEHKGNEGDKYNIPSKQFLGYDLVEQDDEGNNMLPENASGTMKRDEVIEVKYYYIKKASVIVKYVDEKTGEEIAERVVIEGHENDLYDTEEKDIDGYELSKTPENKSGTMTITKNEDGTYDTEIEVIYYYKQISGGVTENHIDIDTEKILTTEKHKGYVGEEYDIPARQFEGYDLVTDKLPGNSSGTMIEEEIVVNYYYKKKAKVIVEYIDKLTGEKIIEDVSIDGHIGDEYITEEKVFDGYDLVEKPANGKGEMTEDEIVVKYYYQRKAEVEVKYLEKGTDYEVSEGSLINGYVGDDYKTEQKEIPYYKFVEKTENAQGTMTEEKITVIYYYEKEIFNLGVDKWVESVNINGISSSAQSINNSNEIYKVDIHRNKADTAEIKVTYKIRITNKGEIEGTVGKITDIIPSGYTFNQEDNNIYWENNNGVLTTDDLNNETIKPGEYKEIKVVLRASESSEKYGQKDNMVILTQMSNSAGYEDIDKEDNSDTSSMIITIATGLDRNDRIIIIGVVQIVLAITIGLLLSYKKKEKNKE